MEYIPIRLSDFNFFPSLSPKSTKAQTKVCGLEYIPIHLAHSLTVRIFQTIENPGQVLRSDDTLIYVPCVMYHIFQNIENQDKVHRLNCNAKHVQLLTLHIFQTMQNPEQVCVSEYSLIRLPDSNISHFSGY